MGSNGTHLVVGVPYSLAEYGGNIEMDGNIENPKLTLNRNTNTLTITGSEVEARYIYGIHGEIFTGVDEDWQTVNMTESDGNWTLTSQVYPGEFGIKKMDAATGSQVQWLSSSEGGTVTADTPLYVQVEGSNWVSDLEGNVTFSFNPDYMTLIVTSPSAWNDITADENATFAIYTIEGNLVKAAANMGDVENLESGMYIVNGQKLMIRK